MGSIEQSSWELGMYCMWTYADLRLDGRCRIAAIASDAHWAASFATISGPPSALASVLLHQHATTLRCRSCAWCWFRVKIACSAWPFSFWATKSEVKNLARWTRTFVTSRLPLDWLMVFYGSNQSQLSMNFYLCFLPKVLLKWQVNFSFHLALFGLYRSLPSQKSHSQWSAFHLFSLFRNMVSCLEDRTELGRDWRQALRRKALQRMGMWLPCQKLARLQKVHQGHLSRWSCRNLLSCRSCARYLGAETLQCTLYRYAV